MLSGALIAQKYRVLRLLGEGAMGSVWAAENELTERQFAIKLIHRTHVMAKELRERMLREARACGRLRHKNVVQLYDVGETEHGDPFLVMELLEGETLEQLLARRGRLPLVQVAAIGCQAASALAIAHDAGIVHRDLKPANLFLHTEPEQGTVVKVLDFGVSKLMADRSSTTTTTGGAVGSPAYMSPEQATADASTGHRADLWSLGVVLFESVSGRQAFAGETAFAVVGNILHGPLPDLARAMPDADPRLSKIIARCLERDPARRMASARQLAAELEELLPRSASAVLRDLEDEPTLSHEASRLPLASGDPVSAPSPHSVPAARGPLRQSLWLPLTAAALGVLALSIVAVVAVAMGQERARSGRSAAVPSAELALAPSAAEPHEPEVSPLAAHSVAAPSSPPPSATARRPVKRSGGAPKATCPEDKVIFGADGKKRCALAGHRVP